MSYIFLLQKLIAIENIDQKLISKDRLFDAFTANISRHEAESSVTLPTETESRTSAALSDTDSNKRFTRQSQAESSQIVEEKRSEPPTASLPIQSTVNRSPKEMNKETKEKNQKTTCSNLYNAISSSSSSSTRSTSSTDRSLSFDHKNKKGSEENEKAEKLDYNPGSNKVVSRSVALKKNESSGKFGDNYDEKTKSKEAKESYKKTRASEEASLISLSSRSDRTAEKNATNQQKSSSTTDQPEPNSVAGSVKRGGSLPPLRDKQIPNELQHLPSIDSSREQSNQVDTAQITRRLSSILNLQSSDSDENIGEEITVDELLHSNDEDSISF
ncbi:hypothetical protein AB6A40_007880 [Gnathostoma spinigerum]|uniref:Uncharacterized protein n=1 Tax=Gnathostoma spinigerum TaxID=75299 RepID=A0ABD6EN16_9BILA